MDNIDVAIDETDEEVIQKAVTFKMFSGLLKAYEEEDGTKVIRGVASSTIADRNGDEIEKSAIDDMVAAANDNMTIFLNHEYRVPEDVAGSVRYAAAAEAGAGPISPIWDMHYDIAVNEVNSRAVETFGAIKGGTKLGLSIGARIPAGGATRNKKTGNYRFQHLELLETSIVGLPANPRSWISSVVKAIKSIDDLDRPTLLEADACGAPCEGGHCKKPKGHDGEHSSDVRYDIEPDTTASDEDDVVTSEDVPTPVVDVPHTTDPEPPAEGDTDSSQGAADSEPEHEPAPQEDTKATVTATLGEALTVLNELTVELVQARSDRDSAYRARDEAIESRDAVLQQAADIIELVASIPMGRKAVLRQAQDQLAGLERIYGPEMTKRLRGSND